MQDNNPEMTRLEELLPFYVNGTLEGAEHRLVEHALKDNEGLRLQVEALQHLRAQMQAKEVPSIGGELGLARLMRQIDTAVTPIAANETKAPLFRLSGLAAGVAVASIILAFVAGTSFQTHEPLYVQASGGGIAATLTVSFQADVTQQLMAETLLSHGMIIVDGPSASGYYRLEMFDEGDLYTVAEALRAQRAVFEFVDDPE